MTQPPKPKLHAESPDAEFTLCGFAFDAYDTGDAEEEVVFAGEGQTVTCPDCRHHIDHVRRAFSRSGKYLGTPKGHTP